MLDNHNITLLPHEPKRPVSLEREHPDIVVIEGVKYAGDVFRTLAFPGPDCLYFFQRNGDVVNIRLVQTIEEAESFFEEVGNGI